MKEKKVNTKQDNFLMYVPRKKHKTWETNNGKVKLIFHHDKAVEKLMRWLVKKPYESDLELDELGSKVWLYMDGKRSVYDIGQDLVKDFGESCQPVYDRLIMFLRYLNKRAWIAFDRGAQEKGRNE